MRFCKTKFLLEILILMWEMYPILSIFKDPILKPRIILIDVNDGIGYHEGMH